MGGLDVLGEDEHADARVRALDRVRGAGALVGEGRRHADVEHHEVGRQRGDRLEQAGRVADRRADLVAGVVEEPGEPFAQQHLVLGDHDPHGSSATSVVPGPFETTSNEPPCAATRSAQSAEPGAGLLARAADAVIGHAHDSEPLRARGAHDDARACACLMALVSPSQAMK